jgi:CDP-glucose 4,6-dehydratase
VEWVISQLVNNWGDGSSFKVDTNESKLHETSYLKLDCSKARIQLGWKPQWSMVECLKRICAWHKAHLNNQDMKIYTMNEIKHYQASILTTL